MISASSTPGTDVAISYPKSGSSIHSMVSSTMACTMADENGMATFLEPGWSSPPPTRPVLSTNTLSSWLSSSSSIRFPMSAMSRGKNGLVPGTRRNLPSSSLPPAEVPVVSPSMKYAAACARSRRGHAGDDVLVPVQDEQEFSRGHLVGGPWVHVRERPRCASVLGVRGVEEVHRTAGIHRHVLQVGIRLGGGVIDGGLE